MTGRKRDPKLKAQACEMLRDGQSVTEVQRATGFSRPTLYRWAKELEIEPLPKPAPPSRRFDRAAVREMMGTHSIEDVCAEFGCSRSFAYMCASGQLE